MKNKKIFTKNIIIFMELVVASLLFIFTLYFTKGVHEINFASITGLILYFLIFFELSRTVIEFIFDEEHLFKVNYLYDMAIIFIIREDLVIITTEHEHIEHELTYLFVTGIMLAMIVAVKIFESRLLINKGFCEEKSKETKKYY